MNEEELQAEEIERAKLSIQPRLLSLLCHNVKTRNHIEITDMKIGMTINGFMHINKVVEGSGVSKQEIIQLCKNGELFWIQLNGEYYVRKIRG